MAVIGRTPPADILIPAPEVSSRHAEIHPAGGDLFVLTDLGSTNGTYANDRRIQSSTIRLTDRVRLGTVPVDLSAWRDKILKRAPISPSAAPLARALSFAPPLVAVATMLLIAAGILFATRETVSRRCEVCSREIFRQAAFFWQAERVRQEAARLRWCQADGDAPMTVQHISRCEYCGKVVDIREEIRPRREEPKGSDTKAGYCTDQCRWLATGRDIYKEGKDVVGSAAQGALDAAREISDRLRK